MFTTQQLLQKNNTIAPLDAEILLAHVIKKPREFLLIHPDFVLTAAQIKKFEALRRRRALGEPVAYLVGHKEFFGFDFSVDKRVLVPRPETELLVEEVISVIARRSEATTKQSHRDKITNLKCQIAKKLQISNHKCDFLLIDIGTGSGCIPISIVKSLHTQNGFPPLLGEGRGVGYSRHDDTPTSVLPPVSSTGQALKGGGSRAITVIGTDISKDALVVARRNARAHGVKIKFLRGNLLLPLLKKSYKLQVTSYNHIIITANLPYGWRAWKNNCSMETVGLKFEPSQALFTGNHGLQLIEELLQQIAKVTSYKLQVTSLLEFDPRQTTQLKKLIKKYLPMASVEIKKDLAGHDRVTKIFNF